MSTDPSTARLLAATSAPAYERPRSTGEAAALLRSTSGPVVFAGAGTKQRWGGTPRPPELVVDTRLMNGMIEHRPADMTAAAQAGMTLAELQRTLAAHGQWLALDPPSEKLGATLGGLLASGENGPRRLRHGSLRDLVIGATLVLADGTTARVGSHVIKNVAGYDLTKLVHGSLGSLALATEVVVRLHPRPEAAAAVTTCCTLDQATALTLQLLASPLEPSAVVWTSADGGFGPRTSGVLQVRYDGRRAAVDAQTGATAAAVTRAGLVASTNDDTTAAGPPSDPTGDPPDGTRARAGVRPSDVPGVAAALAEAAARTGCTTSLVVQCGSGVLDVRVSGPVEGQARCLDGWRRRVLDLGGNVLVQDRPATLDEHLDILGPPPSAVSLLRAVKRSLDPDGRCAPGRFGSWY